MTATASSPSLGGAIVTTAVITTLAVSGLHYLTDSSGKTEREAKEKATIQKKAAESDSARFKLMTDFVARDPNYTLKGVFPRECGLAWFDAPCDLLITAKDGKERVISITVKTFVSPDGIEMRRVLRARLLDFETNRDRVRAETEREAERNDAANSADSFASEGYEDPRQ